MVLGARVLVGETEQVVWRGAGEGVDGLVGIAHHREVARVAQPQLEQALLERVGVLVLVDADPGLLGLDGGGGVGVRLEQLDGEREHVLEVDPVGALLGALVAGVEAREEVGRDWAGPIGGFGCAPNGPAGCGGPWPTRSRRPGPWWA